MGVVAVNLPQSLCQWRAADVGLLARGSRRRSTVQQIISRDDQLKISRGFHDGPGRYAYGYGSSVDG